MRQAFRVFLLFQVSAALFATEYRYYRIPRAALSPEMVQSLGLIEDHIRDDHYVLAYIPTEKSLGRLQTSEPILELDPKFWAHHKIDLTTLQVEKEIIQSGKYEEFHTYVTLTNELKTLAGKYPNLVRLESAGKTVEGRDLWLMRVTNLNSKVQGKPKLLFVSSMHGDEVTGKEMMVYLLREMLQSYGKRERITNMLDNAEIYIMPSMNPDGTERQQRFNAKGIDLNRDFPELNEDPFGGNRAPETRALMELHRNNHFLVALNFHGGSLCVNIPWDSKPNNASNLFGDDTLMHSMAREYADANAPMHANHGGNFDHGVTYGYEWYPIYGGMQDWASYFRQSTHATVEISSIKWPSPSSLSGFWNDNQEALLKYLENGMTGLHLKVTDQSGNALASEIFISSAKRTLKYEGFVHRPSVNQTQTVTVKSAGYATKTVSLNPTLFDGTYTTVVMEKSK